MIVLVAGLFDVCDCGLAEINAKDFGALNNRDFRVFFLVVLFVCLCSNISHISIALWPPSASRVMFVIFVYMIQVVYSLYIYI